MGDFSYVDGSNPPARSLGSRRRSPARGRTARGPPPPPPAPRLAGDEVGYRGCVPDLPPPPPSRPSSARTAAVLAVSAGVLVVALVAFAVVVVQVLSSDAEDPEVVRAPDAPADLCAVIGLDRLEVWVPDADAEATTDESQVNTEASCQVDTAGGVTEDLAYGSLGARVYRYGSIGDPDRAEAQAVEALADRCDGALETGAGIGDESCVPYAEESAGSGRAAVEVRRGADLVTVTYYASPLTADEARERALEAATQIVARLRR